MNSLPQFFFNKRVLTRAIFRVWWRAEFSLKPVGAMVFCLLALMSLGAQAAGPSRLSEAQARYLLLRTGFAPDQAEVDALTGQSAKQAVSVLIGKAKNAKPLHPAPGFSVQLPPVPYRLLKTREEQQAWRQEQQRQGLDLKRWWMREMIESPTPLQERMTLFWHNHFATSQQKVISAQAMWQQQMLLRQGALGSFASLLHGVAKDPAMLVYLDGANNRKEAPNENFAREVMELFTLGEASQGGHYTEQDIKQAARAFTGWSVDRTDFSFKYRPAFHDNSDKTLWGRSGNFDGDEALDILLAQPAAARFIMGKLWKEFVSPEPDQAQIERMAAHFRASGYDIAQALSELFSSDAFWAEINRGTLIKSPVDLVVGTLRQFDVDYSDATPFVLKSAQLGQNLLLPPNVKGWPGQNDWINASTLLERKRFTEQLFRAAAPQTDSPLMAAGMNGLNGTMQKSGSVGGGVIRIGQAQTDVTFNAARWLARYGGFPDRVPSEALKSDLAKVLLQVPATQTIAAGTVGLGYMRALTQDPAYQLK